MSGPAIDANCSVNSSGYTPSSIVDVLHNIPHVNIDLDSSPSEFETSFDYFQAIIIWGAVPILACVCVFILMTVYYICVCCCCKEKKQRPKAFNCGCAFLVSLVIFFCLALIGAGLYAEFTFNKNMLLFINEGTNIIDDFNNVSAELNSFNYTEVNQKLNIVIGDDPEDNQDAVAIQSSLEGIVDGYMTIIYHIADVNNTTTIDDIDYYEEIRHWSLVGYFVLIAFILLIVFVVSLCLSSAGTIIMLIIVGVVTLSVWLVCGGSLSFVILMADVCYNPDEVVRNIFNDTDVKDTIDHYIVCDSACSPFNGVKKNISDSFDEVTDTCGVNYPVDLEEVCQDISMTDQDFTNIATMLTCSESSGIHEYYRRALNNACNDGFLYALILLCLFVVLSVSLIVLMCCLTCFAGLLVSTIKDDFDEDFASYDTPRTATWSQRRSSYTEPYSNGGGNAFTNEEYRLTGLSRNATIEPPRYTDVDRPTSGDYDHFDT